MMLRFVALILYRTSDWVEVFNKVLVVWADMFRLLEGVLLTLLLGVLLRLFCWATLLQ